GHCRQQPPLHLFPRVLLELVTVGHLSSTIVAWFLTGLPTFVCVLAVWFLLLRSATVPSPLPLPSLRPTVNAVPSCVARAARRAHLVQGPGLHGASARDRHKSAQLGYSSS